MMFWLSNSCKSGNKLCGLWIRYAQIWSINHKNRGKVWQLHVLQKCCLVFVQKIRIWFEVKQVKLHLCWWNTAIVFIDTYPWTPKPWKMKVLHSQVWVITPKYEAMVVFTWNLGNAGICKGILLRNPSDIRHDHGIEFQCLVRLSVFFGNEWIRLKSILQGGW